MDVTEHRGFDAELAEYQSHRPQDPNGYFRHTLNSLSDDLQAIQAGDYWRFDFQSFDAHRHEAGADAVGFFTELYRYLRSRLIRSFEKGVFCLDAMNTAAPERQRARGFFRNLLDELRNTPAEPLNPDDPEAVHFEIGLLLFDAVRGRISDGAIAAIKAVSDVSATTGQKEPDDHGAVWSKPMSKSRMMSALGIDSEHTFKKYADRIGIESDSRKLHRIRLDKMQPKDREKLEKA